MFPLIFGFLPLSTPIPPALASLPANPVALPIGTPLSQQVAEQPRHILPIFEVQTEEDAYCLGFNLPAIAFSPNSQRLAVSAHGYVQSLCGGGPSNLTLWDVETGERVATLVEGGVVEIFANLPDTDDDFNALGGDLAGAIAFTPDGQILVAAMADKTVRLWNAQTGAPLRTLTGHTRAVRALVMSPDGKTFLSGAADSTIRVWDTQTGQTLQVLNETLPVRHLVMSPDGAHLATVLANSTLNDTTVHLWRKQGDRWVRVAWEQVFPLEILGPVFRTRTHSDIEALVRFGLGGEVLLTGHYDGVVRMWNADTGVRMRSLQRHRDLINILTVTPDGQFLASQSDDGETAFWHLATGRWIRTVTDLGRLDSFTQDGRFLLTHDPTESLLWNWRLPEPAIVHRYAESSIRLAPDEQTFVAPYINYTLGLWRDDHLR